MIIEGRGNAEVPGRPFLTAGVAESPDGELCRESRVAAPRYVPAGTVLDQHDGVITYLSAVAFRTSRHARARLAHPAASSLRRTQLALLRSPARGCRSASRCCLSPGSGAAQRYRLCCAGVLQQSHTSHCRCATPFLPDHCLGCSTPGVRAAPGTNSRRARRGRGSRPPRGHREAFITEHYWGYTRLRDWPDPGVSRRAFALGRLARRNSLRSRTLGHSVGRCSPPP